MRARALSFGSVAAEYAALRPGYPSDAVAFLVGDRSARVLDLGAGTGLLTDVLLAAGHDVVAVDPAPEMLAHLTARHPQVATLAGDAEALPLVDAAVDAVLVGQAAHWFDPRPAAAQMRRVLRPGGVVGLLWNVRDDRIPWVAALSELMAGEALAGVEETVVAAFAAELRAHVETVESAVVQRLPPEDVVRRTATSSYVVTMADTDRQAFLRRVRQLVDTHPDTRGQALIPVAYRTRAFRLTPG
ncbi:class I SAM-dependent methyltransferase [Blastococcus sp. CT_GayMR16]|nr:class I SAM-dependent methyltransferase [Blastococcus sp. CT_GayMR16]